MPNLVLYIIGVSGCGKSTIGRSLSEKTGIPFYDGDDFHPAANIEKMKAGQALTDEDRWGWLAAINQFAQDTIQEGALIIACSALKEKYRRVLEKELEGKCKWIHLQLDFDLIAKRLEERSDHFMPPDLLASQFEDLEIPKNALHITNVEVKDTVAQILAGLPKQ